MLWSGKSWFPFRTCRLRLEEDAGASGADGSLFLGGQIGGSLALVPRKMNRFDACANSDLWERKTDRRRAEGFKMILHVGATLTGGGPSPLFASHPEIFHRDFDWNKVKADTMSPDQVKLPKRAQPSRRRTRACEVGGNRFLTRLRDRLARRSSHPIASKSQTPRPLSPVREPRAKTRRALGKPLLLSEKKNVTHYFLGQYSI